MLAELFAVMANPLLKLLEVPSAGRVYVRGELIEMMAAAPVKVNAFISTLIEIARNHELRTFWFSRVVGCGGMD